METVSRKDMRLVLGEAKRHERMAEVCYESALRRDHEAVAAALRRCARAAMWNRRDMKRARKGAGEMIEIPSEIYALVNELLASVDERTGVVKFPKRATEIVKDLSAYARSTVSDRLDGPMLDGWTPENIWTEILLHRIVSENARHRATAVIIRAPALEKALAAQRRCRVCGCTDDNACIPTSCYWVEADLCSECAGND